jgi:hypothetical protein
LDFIPFQVYRIGCGYNQSELDHINYNIADIHGFENAVSGEEYKLVCVAV